MPHSAPREPRSPSRSSWQVELVVFVMSAAIVLATTAVYVGQPLLDRHCFRQAQTAVTAAWLATNLDPRRMFVYETPLLGHPWRIPMEFPLYQWIVAAIHRATAAPLTETGRLVAIVFHAACLWPAWGIIRSLGGGQRHWLVFASLFLTAPVYHHWSRTFLIETMAVFFSMAYLASSMRWHDTPRLSWLVAAVAAAVTARLVKVTTLPPFLATALAYSAWRAWKTHRWREITRNASATVTGWPRRLLEACVLLPPLVAVVTVEAWVIASDIVKNASPMTVGLTSQSLESWNYGSAEQRLSIALWVRTLIDRAIPEAVGWCGVPVLIWALLRLRGRQRLLVAFLITLYIGSFLIFTNLHVIHDYYQCANACILVAALTAAATALTTGMAATPRSLLLGALLLSNLWASRIALDMEWHDFSRDARLAAARMIRERMPEEDVIVVVGMDWSGEVAYHACRRAVYLPGWTPADVVERFVADPSTLTGERRLGGMVIRYDEGGSAFKPGDPRHTAIERLLDSVEDAWKPVRVGLLIVAIRPRDQEPPNVVCPEP